LFVLFPIIFICYIIIVFAKLVQIERITK